MIAPSGPPPSTPEVGWTLQLNTCNESDPFQTFSLQGNKVTQVSSGLCVSQQLGNDNSLYLDTCGKSGQSWYGVGNTIANVTSGTGASCVNFNNVNNVLTIGNPVIPYSCDPAQWNAKFSFKSSGNNVIQALNEDGSLSEACISVAPALNPSLWSIPFLDAWSLKDY